MKASRAQRHSELRPEAGRWSLHGEKWSGICKSSGAVLEAGGCPWQVSAQKLAGAVQPRTGHPLAFPQGSDRLVKGPAAGWWEGVSWHEGF